MTMIPKGALSDSVWNLLRSLRKASSAFFTLSNVSQIDQVNEVLSVTDRCRRDIHMDYFPVFCNTFEFIA